LPIEKIVKACHAQIISEKRRQTHFFSYEPGGQRMRSASDPRHSYGSTLFRSNR
jgi:hypothetical protein